MIMMRGGQQNTLWRINKSVIFSRLLYGSEVYYYDMKSNNFLMLERIYHAGIRSSLGTYRTSPVISMTYESGQNTLRYEICIKNLSYWLITLSNDHLTCYLDPNVAACSLETFSLFEEVCREISIHPTHLPQTHINPALWLMGKINMCLEMSIFPKQFFAPRVLRIQALLLLERYKNMINIFTDGSLSDNWARFFCC